MYRRCSAPKTPQIYVMLAWTLISDRGWLGWSVRGGHGCFIQWVGDGRRGPWWFREGHRRCLVVGEAKVTGRLLAWLSGVGMDDNTYKATPSL